MRGTTPTIKCTFKDVDLTQFMCFITLAQRRKRILLTIQSPNINIAFEDNESTLSFTLTQEQTLMFEPDEAVKIQLRAINASGKAIKSKVKEIPIDEILLGGVIKYAI